jgi:hypothetical protein
VAVASKPLAVSAWRNWPHQLTYVRRRHRVASFFSHGRCVRLDAIVATACAKPCVAGMQAFSTDFVTDKASAFGEESNLWRSALQQAEVVDVDKPTIKPARHRRAANTRAFEERVVQHGDARLIHNAPKNLARHAARCLPFRADLSTISPAGSYLMEITCEKMELKDDPTHVPRKLREGTCCPPTSRHTERSNIIFT